MTVVLSIAASDMLIMAVDSGAEKLRAAAKELEMAIAEGNLAADDVKLADVVESCYILKLGKKTTINLIHQENFHGRRSYPLGNVNMY
jgi:hypothetical protein